MAVETTAVKTAHDLPANIPEPPAELQRQLLVANLRGFGWISDRVASLTEGRAPDDGVQAAAGFGLRRGRQPNDDGETTSMTLDLRAPR